LDALHHGEPRAVARAPNDEGAGLVGRGTRDEGRGTRDEGRGTRDEGRGTRDEGRGTRDEGRGTRGATEGTTEASLVALSSCLVRLRSSCDAGVTVCAHRLRSVTEREWDSARSSIIAI